MLTVRCYNVVSYILTIFNNEHIVFQQKPMTVNPSMPSFLDSAVPSPPPLRPVAEPQKQQPNLLQAQQPPPQSMPQFLNDDLQLSESDDDSD